MTKNDIVNELNKMGYEVREENVVKNGVEFLGISIIDSDRYMIPVFYVEDIITKAEQSGATVKEIVRDMLKIHNDALRESEELNKPIHFNREDFLKRLYVKCKTEFEGIEKYLFLRMEALNDAIYSAKISKNILKNVDVDESEAWETAENNVRKETEIIQLSRFPMSAEECEMFVISNKSRFRGASAVLNKKVMKAFANLVNTKKIMILPSSIHEMILIPCHDCEYDIESCSEIVKLVNENEVELTEQLTDRAYIIEV